jgi:hypothetical protein
MTKSRLSAFLYLLLVFLSGALVGAFAHRLYMVNTALTAGGGAAGPARQENPEEVRKRVVQEMKDRVKLDDRQVIELNRIFDQTRDRFDQLHQKMNEEGHKLRDNQVEEVKAILRPDQVSLYDQLRAEHDAARKRRHQQDANKK